MVFHHVLDRVFSTWSHIAALRVLQDSAVGMTGREISRLAGMTHRSCLKALSELEEISIVNRLIGGRDHRFSLNREHILVTEGILPLLNLERKLLQEVSELLRKRLARYVQGIILFGSVVRKTETTQSDLDVCLLIGKERERETISNRVNTIAPQFRKRFGAGLSPFIIPVSDFRQRARAQQPPMSEIIKEGVVIAGKTIREILRG